MMRRAPLKPTEAEVQASIVERWDFLQTAGQIGPGFKLLAVRNEQSHGGRSAALQGARLNKLGRRRGAPDLQVLGPGGRVFQAEVKTPRGDLSKAQRSWRDWCKENASPWALWRSQEDAERSWREWGIL